MAAKKQTGKAAAISPFQQVLPKGVRAGSDKLVLRLDFYTECIEMQQFNEQGHGGKMRMVDPRELAKTLAAEVRYDSGLLPENTLWWQAGKDGARIALYEPPRIWRLALQTDVSKQPERYNTPMPGLIFICHPAGPPHVYAAARRPEGLKDRIYKAPLANIYNDGRSCPGNNRYPADIRDIPKWFMVSFFTRAADVHERSRRFKDDITLMWKHLDKIKAKEYPLSDLYYQGTVGELVGR
jgi:hypothetical protein